jgi:hypothetical protein
MNTRKLNPLVKISVAGMFCMLLMATLNSCARKISFLNSSVVPAARGKVQVKKDNNNNYKISVELYNLAEVSRLTPPRKAYVVWMFTAENLTKNIGQINSSTGRFSKTLKASFETVSAFKPVRIFITAEDEADTQYPNAEVISTANF